MDLYDAGMFLERQGFSDENIDKFLEHFGKKGMHWGQRSKTQKVGIVGAGLIVGTAGQTVLNRITGGNPKIALVAGPIAIAAGAISVGRLLDRQGRTKVQDAKTKTSKHRSATGKEKALVVGVGAAYALTVIKSIGRAQTLLNQT